MKKADWEKFVQRYNITGWQHQEIGMGSQLICLGIKSDRVVSLFPVVNPFPMSEKVFYDVAFPMLFGQTTLMVQGNVEIMHLADVLEKAKVALIELALKFNK